MTTASELARRVELKRKELEDYVQENKGVIEHYLQLRDQHEKLTTLACNTLIKESHAQHGI